MQNEAKNHSLVNQAAIFPSGVPSNQPNDDVTLESMRAVMKAYVLCSQEGRLDPEVKLAIQRQYEALRAQLKDSMLMEYAAFDVMERMYSREYLTI